MVSEAHFYDWVQSYLESNLECFASKQRTGPQIVGFADVVGVRDVGGDTTGNVELIAVEVKLNRSPFGKNLGQAKGYSLFAHKCYLAVRMTRGDHFTSSQLELATRLGVGLIEISGWKKKRCTEVLSPIYGEPIQALAEVALYNMGYVRCSVCGSLVEGQRESDYSHHRPRALREQKIYYYSRHLRDRGRIRRLMFKRQAASRMTRTSYVCPDCLTSLLNE